MKIIFTDGGIFECTNIEFWNGYIVANDYAMIDLEEVERIEE